jgi:dTDP-4-amino-4,6-dideoxygalactose transaminase
MSNGLAIDGGTKIYTSTMPAWPSYAEDEIAAVTEVLKSGKVNQWTGNTVFEFEKAFCAYTGSKHAIALANGSLAIELLLRVMGIGDGDEVIVTPRSFLASASSVELTGAKAVFADIDPHSQNLTAETIKEKITTRTKAVIPVHLNGLPCDMPAIMEVAKQHDIKVIEDCAQAHAATINGMPVGSFGDAAAYSFCQDKIISTGGEGGIITLDDDSMWNAAWSYKDHGKSREAVFERSHPAGYRWLHESIGTNWRMTAMQAAIGILQLQKLPEWNHARAKNAGRIIAGLQERSSLEFQTVPEGMHHAWYRLPLTIDQDKLKDGWDRDRVMLAVNAEGIACTVGSCPALYREKAYLGPDAPVLSPKSEKLGKDSMVLLCHPTLDDEYLDATVAAFNKVLAIAEK